MDLQYTPRDALDEESRLLRTRWSSAYRDAGEGARVNVFQSLRPDGALACHDDIAIERLVDPATTDMLHHERLGDAAASTQALFDAIKRTVRPPDGYVRLRRSGRNR